MPHATINIENSLFDLLRESTSNIEGYPGAFGATKNAIKWHDKQVTYGVLKQTIAAFDQYAVSSEHAEPETQELGIALAGKLSKLTASYDRLEAEGAVSKTTEEAFAPGRLPISNFKDALTYSPTSVSPADVTSMRSMLMQIKNFADANLDASSIHSLEAEVDEVNQDIDAFIVGGPTATAEQISLQAKLVLDLGKVRDMAKVLFADLVLAPDCSMGKALVTVTVPSVWEASAASGFYYDLGALTSLQTTYSNLDIWLEGREGNLNLSGLVGAAAEEVILYLW